MAQERRRGEELEIAILNAAKDIIETRGYSELTFQNVAKEAATSRTVIYRRYTTTLELLQALVRYKSQMIFDGPLIDLVEDQKSLREDLISVMLLFQKIFENVGLGVMDAMLFELRQNNKYSMNWLNSAQQNNIKLMEKIQTFAIERGEINHEFTRIQMLLPFNTLRIENLLNGKAITTEYIYQLVDEILLPVFLGKEN